MPGFSGVTVMEEMKKNNQTVSEQKLYNYILDWKPHWNNSQKREAIASAIRNLAMLKWISVDFSKELPVPSEKFEFLTVRYEIKE